MTTIVTRAGKGSPLTNNEMDTNLTNLNTYKCETANNLSDLTNATTARSNLGLVIGTNVPSPTGTGASGTWGINVTGSAGSATTATQVSNSHTAGTGLSGSTFNGSAAVTWTLATSGVGAGSYGSASAIPVITVDAYGRATSITTATVASGLGFRNRIINGAMMIDQRNAGAAQTVSNGSIVYTLDRWLVYTGGSSVTTQRTGAAGSYALQITGNTGNSGIKVLQRIEANNIADTASQNVTVSFTISSTTLTNVGLFYNTPTATDNFGSLNTTGTISGSVPVTSTPTRQSVTFAMPSSATNGFQLLFQTGAFTSGTLTITGVQLEKGSTATSFDYRPYGTELALCQRYYQKFVGAGGSAALSNLSIASSTTNAYVPFVFPVVMRAAPTASRFQGALYNPSIGGFNLTNLTFLSASTTGIVYTATVASGLTAGSYYWLSCRDTGGTNDYVDLTAEL